MSSPLSSLACVMAGPGAGVADDLSAAVSATDLAPDIRFFASQRMRFNGWDVRGRHLATTRTGQILKNVTHPYIGSNFRNRQNVDGRRLRRKFATVCFATVTAAPKRADGLKPLRCHDCAGFCTKKQIISGKSDFALLTDGWRNASPRHGRSPSGQAVLPHRSDSIHRRFMPISRIAQSHGSR